jgi:hypothetical protein
LDNYVDKLIYWLTGKCHWCVWSFKRKYTE